MWQALVDPRMVKQYMMGTEVVSDWKRGSAIVWKGEYEGKTFEDKGKILEIEPGQRISYSHFSPLTGDPDVPENYHTVTVERQPRREARQHRGHPDPGQQRRRRIARPLGRVLAGHARPAEGDRRALASGGRGQGAGGMSAPTS